MSRKRDAVQKVVGIFEGDLAGKTVAIWGAAFKPGTARIDHAPVLTLLEALWAQGHGQTTRPGGYSSALLGGWAAE